MAYMLMPSEVARLVYGYIDDLEGCKDVARQFLETCPLLREFAEGYRRGARYSAKINNRSLLDYLNNPPPPPASDHESTKSSVQSSELNHSTAIQPQQSSFNEQMLVATVTDAITKAFEAATRKQAQDHDRSISQIQEDQAELKSLLLNSVHNDLLPKIQSIVQSVEGNIIHLLHEQSSKLQHNSSHSSDHMKTPRNDRKRHSSQHDRTNAFSPAAHSSLITTPRRKSFTPRRLHTHTPHPQHQAPLTPGSSRVRDSPATSAMSQSPYTTDPPSQYSQYSEITDCSELDIQAYIDKPLVVNKFIESSSSLDMASRIAQAINMAKSNINMDGGSALQSMVSSAVDSANSAQQQPLMQSNNTDQQLENTYASQQMQELLYNATNALNDDSEYNQLVDSVILSTPFKLFEALTPSSVATSNGSLNTPNIFSDMDGNSSNKENGDDLDLIPVKNFAKDLATPDKSKRLHSQSSQQSIFGETTNSNNTLQPSNGVAQLNQTSVVDVTNQSCTASSDDESTLILSGSSLNQSKLSQNSSHSQGLEAQSRNNLSNDNSKKKPLVSRPVFLNQHLKGGAKPSFSKLVANQLSIRKSLNYSGREENTMENNNKAEKRNSSLRSSSKSKSSQEVLTTTIDKVADGSVSKPPTPVHAINSGNFQISNNQVISTSTSQPAILPAQQPATTYYLPPGTTLWDPNNGMTTSEPIYVLPEGFQLLNFQTQVTSTSQNVYLPIAPNPDQQQQQQPQQVVDSKASSTAINVSSSMPILNRLVNGGTPLKSNAMLEEAATHDAGKKAGSTRPSILSKSDKKKSSESLYSGSLSNNVSLAGIEASPLRSRKEPRKSELGRRQLLDGMDDSEEASHSQSTSLKRKNESLSNSKSKKATRPAETNAVRDQVKTLMSTNIDAFLQTVHQQSNGENGKKSNKRSSSANSDKSKRSEKRAEKQSGSRSGKAK